MAPLLTNSWHPVGV